MSQVILHYFPRGPYLSLMNPAFRCKSQCFHQKMMMNLFSLSNIVTFLL
nr:hypothetical protein Iba_scaffold59225CG0020 [Ipomoea batatas]GMD82934.1 hypothetical protein Iba_chr14aCG0210 [Ipomoea batatas]GMD91621.1 hypothetical protein Iba_chr14eCG1150 [Ipomoea batatas]GME12631.1 hypothetical protein Iba_scaffold14040CG0040 [Ipomoea batatas]GME12634.1 hypothetical protein Iba_scaffold14040CG0070 [Ipomoea batatas]